MRHFLNDFAALVREREIILRPDKGSQTLFVEWPKREPEPAASTTTAVRSIRAIVADLQV